MLSFCHNTHVWQTDRRMDGETESRQQYCAYASQSHGKNCRLWGPFGGLGATYAVHLRLIGKLVGDFLLVVFELFFARCFRFVTIHALTDRQTDGRLLIRPCLHSCSTVKITPHNSAPSQQKSWVCLWLFSLETIARLNWNFNSNACAEWSQFTFSY